MSASRHASDYAREYARRGWNPVPVHFKTKKPIGKDWQTRVIREADVPKYFNGAPQNIGVVLERVVAASPTSTWTAARPWRLRLTSCPRPNRVRQSIEPRLALAVHQQPA